MDEIQDQIEGVEEETATVKELYDLVERYQVPVNPEDLAVYQVRTGIGIMLQPYIIMLHVHV